MQTPDKEPLLLPGFSSTCVRPLLRLLAHGVAGSRGFHSADSRERTPPGRIGAMRHSRGDHRQGDGPLVEKREFLSPAMLTEPHSRIPHTHEVR